MEAGQLGPGLIAFQEQIFRAVFILDGYAGGTDAAVRPGEANLLPKINAAAKLSGALNLLRHAEEAVQIGQGIDGRIQQGTAGHHGIGHPGSVVDSHAAMIQMHTAQGPIFPGIQPCFDLIGDGGEPGPHGLGKIKMLFPAEADHFLRFFRVGGDGLFTEDGFAEIQGLQGVFIMGGMGCDDVDAVHTGAGNGLLRGRGGNGAAG